jgi:alpha-1,6-mannosyltransferase
MQLAGDSGFRPVSQQPLLWLAASLVPLAAAVLLRLSGPSFAYDIEVIDRPLLALTAAYCMASALYLFALWFLLPRDSNPSPHHTSLACLAIVIVSGFAARLVMFGSVPVQENDFYRYLWDGAVTANGMNPWQHAPQTVLNGDAGSALTALGDHGGHVLSRVNYAELRTVYPPITQLAFAVAYWLKPFSLDAWRAVLLALELGMLATILALLRASAKPALWCAVYWWNPIAIKEVMNAGHMEPVVMLPVLGALMLATRSRTIAASIVTAIAAGAKLWPVLLLPVLWRGSLHRPALIFTAAVAFAVTTALLYWAVLAAGFDESSGFVAFGMHWQRISASFSALLWLSAQLPQTLLKTELLARLAAAGLVAAIVLFSNRSAPAGADDISRKFMVAAAALLLLSPVQLPWYYLWLLPFLCIHPNPALLLISATFPVYYAFFELTAHNVGEAWLEALVWAMWLPVWAALLAQWWPRAQTCRTRVAAGSS